MPLTFILAPNFDTSCWIFTVQLPYPILGISSRIVTSLERFYLDVDIIPVYWEIVKALRTEKTPVLASGE